MRLDWWWGNSTDDSVEGFSRKLGWNVRRGRVVSQGWVG